ncbi:MAG: hypothetical protein ACRDDA_05230 [Aeromonas sp.]
MEGQYDKGCEEYGTCGPLELKSQWDKAVVQALSGINDKEKKIMEKN